MVGLAALFFSDAAAAGNAIRQEFQGMLSDGGKAQEVFDANPGLFLGKEWDGVIIEEWEDLHDLAQNSAGFWQSAIFAFVRVD